MKEKSGTVQWYCKLFSELTNKELYCILQLRSEIFVVEQNCVYQDCDDKDYDSWHFFGKEDSSIIAYTRILPAGISYPDFASIGRVVVSPAKRRSGMGKLLMKKSIEQTRILFGDVPIYIGAQVYLQKFYTELGFEPAGDPYDEDGIPHITMAIYPSAR